MISSHLAVCAFVILTLFGQPEAYGSEEESIGDGRFFLTRNMEVLGAVWDVQDSAQCCARCDIAHPTTQMTNYYRDEYDKYCECLKQNPRGYRPVTHEGKHYSSHLCEEEPEYADYADYADYEKPKVYQPRTTTTTTPRPSSPDDCKTQPPQIVETRGFGSFQNCPQNHKGEYYNKTTCDFMFSWIRAIDVSERAGSRNSRNDNRVHLCQISVETESFILSG